MTAYRNRQYAALLAGIAVLFTGASVLAAAVNGGPWAPVAVVAALGAFCGLRLARAGVYADEGGIRVLNPLRTVRVPWERVVRFSLRPHKGFPAVGFVELVDDEPIQIWGIQARTSSAVSRRIPEQVVAELNERLEHERAARRAAG